MRISNQLKYLFFFSILIISCKKDWLDKKPNKNLTVPQTLKDFEAMLDNTTLNNVSGLSLGEVGTDEFYVLESRWQLGFDDYLINAYTWAHDRPYKGIFDWIYSYQAILVSNVIMEGIDKIKTNESDIEQWSRIKGGALFTRAYRFYELSQAFAPVYDESSASSDLGIPVRLESDISIPAVRSSNKKVYEQIISDLQIAKELLPIIPLIKTRPSKPAVFALLSRVYMSMQDYVNAGVYADSCLKLYNTLIDYNSLPTTANFIGIFNDEVIYHLVSASYNIMTTSARIDTTLYNSYDSSDLRKIIFLKKNADGTIVFKGNYNNTNTPLFFGLATDEMYLIRAECRARSGDLANALNDLNTLIKKRWKNSAQYTPYVATTPQQVLGYILSERRKELIMRGQRWLDLRRLNKESQFSTTLKRTIGGNTYTLPPNSFKYVLPIPDDVILLSGMQQNLGW